MKFDFDGQALRFFQEKNHSELTLDLEELNPNCCIGRLPESKIHHAPPERPDQYRHFSTHGINIHISKSLRTEETLSLHMSGIGPFKKLEVSGLNLIL